MLRITPEHGKNYGRGFQLVFANGWTASVQFGNSNYCSQRDTRKPDEMGNFESLDAEIAAFDREGSWHKFAHDDVKGYCNANEVAAFIAMVAAK